MVSSSAMSKNGSEEATDANREPKEPTDAAEQMAAPAEAKLEPAYITYLRRHPQGNDWISKRSRHVDRLRVDEINKRIEFYDLLQEVLMNPDTLPRSNSKPAQPESNGLDIDQMAPSHENPIGETELLECSSAVKEGSSTQEVSVSGSVDNKEGDSTGGPISDCLETNLRSSLDASSTATPTLDDGVAEVVEDVENILRRSEYPLETGSPTTPPKDTKRNDQPLREFFETSSSDHRQNLESTPNIDAEMKFVHEQRGAKPRTSSRGTLKFSPDSLGSGDASTNDTSGGIEQQYDDGSSFTSSGGDIAQAWKLAEEFNGSLGTTMAQFRKEIEEILAEQKLGLVYPIELAGAYYSKFGRPIKSCVKNFSYEALYAWLRCFSSLDLSPLIL